MGVDLLFVVQDGGTSLFGVEDWGTPPICG